MTGQKARLPSRGGSRPGSEAPFSVPTGHRNLQLIFSLPPLHPGAQQSGGNSELADTTPALLSQEDDSGDTPCFTDITTLPPHVHVFHLLFLSRPFPHWTLHHARTHVKPSHATVYPEVAPDLRRTLRFLPPTDTGASQREHLPEPPALGRPPHRRPATLGRNAGSNSVRASPGLALLQHT